MKMKKYFMIALMASLITGAMSSCSDNDNKGEAPRLFRPVASLETNTNTIKAKWDNISGATEYQLTLYRLIGTDEAGENTYEPCATATCEKSPYTFTDLAWDEKYHVEISCEGNGKSSGVYTTSDVSVAYVSSLKSVKTIDNAARITWDLSGVTIKAIVATPAEGGEPVIKKVSSTNYEAGSVDIAGLTPSTKYVFAAYSDSENFTNSTTSLACSSPHFEIASKKASAVTFCRSKLCSTRKRITSSLLLNLICAISHIFNQMAFNVNAISKRIICPL